MIELNAKNVGEVERQVGLLAANDDTLLLNIKENSQQIEELRRATCTDVRKLMDSIELIELKSSLTASLDTIDHDIRMMPQGRLPAHTTLQRGLFINCIKAQTFIGEEETVTS